MPSVTVDPEPIVVRSSPKVWTAGVTAGIDLALSLVEADFGADVAQTVARYLVRYLRRPGGATQFASPVWIRGPGESPSKASAKTKALATAMMGRELMKPAPLEATTLLLWDQAIRVARGRGRKRRHAVRSLR